MHFVYASEAESRVIDCNASSDEMVMTKLKTLIVCEQMPLHRGGCKEGNFIFAFCHTDASWGVHTIIIHVKQIIQTKCLVHTAI